MTTATRSPTFSARALTALSAEPRAGACQTVGSLPDCVNLILYAGDDFYVDLEIVDSVGNPQDLTDAVPSASVRLAAGSAEILAAFECVVTGNIITLHLPSGQTTGLPPNTVWDCQIANPSVTTLCSGTVTTTAEVTRP